MWPVSISSLPAIAWSVIIIRCILFFLKLLHLYATSGMFYAPFYFECLDVACGRHQYSFTAAHDMLTPRNSLNNSGELHDARLILLCSLLLLFLAKWRWV